MTLTRKIVSPAGDDDFVRVAVGKVGDKLLAAPLSRGAGHYIACAGGRVGTYSKRHAGHGGRWASADPFVSELGGDRKNDSVVIGSHDLTLDLMAQFLSHHDRRLASANVGSQGGLVALRRGEAHFAGSHLLNPDTGEYNISYVRQYMPNIPVKVVALVGREQGLIVKKGNPKGIKGGFPSRSR